MKSKKKTVVKPKPVSKVIGVVNLQYVQINVPDVHIDATVEALSHAILSDYYAQYLTLKQVTGNE